MDMTVDPGGAWRGWLGSGGVSGREGWRGVSPRSANAHSPPDVTTNGSPTAAHSLQPHSYNRSTAAAAAAAGGGGDAADRALSTSLSAAAGGRAVTGQGRTTSSSSSPWIIGLPNLSTTGEVVREEPWATDGSLTANTTAWPPTWSSNTTNLSSPNLTSHTAAAMGPNMTAHYPEVTDQYSEVAYPGDVVSPGNTSVLSPGGHGVWDADQGVAPLGLLVIVVLTIAGNVLVCLAVKMDRRLQHMTYYFLVSMAILHISMATILMPPAIMVLFEGEAVREM